MRRPRSKRGQALVESAMVIPLLLLLLLGGYDVSLFVSSKVIAITAVRHGARLAAELAGTGTSTPQNCAGVQASGTTLASIDQQIIRTVLSGTQTMNFTKIDEIDIYLPSKSDGTFTGGDPIDQFKGDGTAFGTQTAALTKRCSGPLTFETSIAVRMIWHYFPPDGIPTKVIPVPPGIALPDATNGLIDYSVEKANLCTDNCVN